MSIGDGNTVKVTIKKAARAQRNTFKREIVTLSKIMHPNIVHFHGLIADGTCYGFVAFTLASIIIAMI